MPMTVIDSIIHQLGQLNFTGKVNLNLYGEPLMDARILSIVANVADIGAVPVIYTNGDYLSDSTARNLKRFSNGRVVVCVTDHNRIKNGMLEELAAYHGFRYRKFSDGQDVLHNRCGLVDHPLAKARAASCFPETPNMYINARGEAQLCCNDYLAEVTYGDVIDKGLLDIWNDPLYTEHRSKLPNPGLDICRRCNCNA